MVKNKSTGIILLVFITSALTYYLYSKVKAPKTSEKGAQAFLDFEADLRNGEAMIDKVLLESIDVLRAHKDSPPLFSLEKDYTVDANGVFSNHAKTMKSNAYVNAGVNVDESLKRYFAETDYLETFWENKKAAFEDKLKWQYTYHLKSNTIRMYPWLNFSELFGASTQWSLVSYFKTNATIIPFEKKSFCTRLYDDVAGIGLSISCCKFYRPTDEFADAVLSCADFGLREPLQKLRTGLSIEKKCFSKLILESNAPAFAYDPEVVFDFQSGQIQKGKGISNEYITSDVLYSSDFPLFNLKAAAVGCIR